MGYSLFQLTSLPVAFIGSALQCIFEMPNNRSRCPCVFSEELDRWRKLSSLYGSPDRSTIATEYPSQVRLKQNGLFAKLGYTLWKFVSVDPLFEFSC